MSITPPSPRVSIIVPCYRQAQYLRESIGRLAGQTLAAWEAVIVNDGSPDDTAQIAQALAQEDPRVRYVEKPNGGLSSARNAGIKACRGEFVQFLDADDYIAPGKLQAQVEHLDKHLGADLVYGNAWYFRDDRPAAYSRSKTPLFQEGQADLDWIAQRALNQQPVLEKLAQWNLFPVCAPLVRRRLIERVGHFDESLMALEDWEYWTRCAAKGARFDFEARAGTDCYVRVHPASMSHDKQRMARAEYEMAAVVLTYLEDRAARKRTLQRAVAGITEDDSAGWQQACTRLRQSRLKGNETFALTLRSLLLHKLRSPVTVRRALHRMAPAYGFLLGAH